MEEDLEILYSPSRWAKRLSSNEVMKYHVNFLNEYSNAERDLIPHRLNQSYGPGNNDVFDIFGTDLNDNSPILIHIHGGYYQEKSIRHSNHAFLSKNMHKNGIKTILLEYDLCPKIGLFELLVNIQRGLKKCIQYAKSINSRGVYLAGHSAGAHAIATFFTEFRKSLEQEDRNIIKAAFLISGFYDMVPVTKMSVNNVLKISEESARDKLSPLNDKLEYGNTKMYVIVAEYDSPSFIRQAREFHKKLQNECAKTELKVILNVDHFNIIENLYFDEFELTQLIIKVINEIE